MEAKQVNLLTFLQRPNQFVIPIYQRTYSWTTKQRTQLWDDILRVAADEAIPAHFLGSIVYVQEGVYHVATVPELLVIDGQQRLATLSLLLAALGRAMEGRGATASSWQKIASYYLFNTLETGNGRYRLLLTKGDQETLICLLEGRDLPLTASSQLVDNYRFFEDQIKKTTLDLDALYRGIGKLIIVDIALDRHYDNPQLIFESLNSTGLDLSQADLIRNYVLMGCAPGLQTELYETYWFPMEQGFGGADNASLFDRFMRDFLTIETRGQIPNIGEVYENFKVYAGTKPGAVREMLARVYHYSKLFVKLVYARDEDADVALAMGDINTLHVEVAYPFLMEVLEDQRAGLLTKSELVVILRLVESYVFRRAICGIPTNSLNKTFANLAREITKSAYVESVEAALLLKDSYKRMPSDDEFQRELMVKELYHFARRNYVLRKLENQGRREPVDVESYTIEHVMPQNPDLSADWQEELGPRWRELQTRYLHTIGNLTLTGYNSELSDRPFREKQSMVGGFKDSPIRLNHSLASLEHWTEEQIQRRASTIADLATQIWALPNLSAAILSKYQTPAAPPDAKYTLADHGGSLQGHVLELFEALRKRILNLDASVREEPKKYYIAYKNTSNFVDVVPQKSRLLLMLNMRFSEVRDPLRLCRDVSKVGRWGNGEAEVPFSSLEELDYMMSLVLQSWHKHSNHAEA
jgi:uncharacterized protein with ParB-like and HNH nuclease domain/predicted transport protein